MAVGRSLGGGGVVGVDLGLPFRVGPGGRQREAERLPPRVDHHQEVVVDHEGAVLGAIGVVRSVQVDGDGQRGRIRPVAIVHAGAGGREPLELGCLDARQEAPAAEYRVGAAERDQAPEIGRAHV